MVLSGGTLYGVANGGGTNGWGALFAVRTNGTFYTNLHSFTFTDGQYPEADLIQSGGTLFGTTPGGGSFSRGTVFAINTNGTGYTNFYNFSPASGSPATNSDGLFPSCRLVLLGTNLYGTTTEGGMAGSGTIFKIGTNGTGFSVMHHFTATNASGANSDGAFPRSGLTWVGNTLYGTAFAGGAAGNGTVFKINLDGTGFTTLYSFSATNNAGGTNLDGAHPVGGLLVVGTSFYGTASAGGTAGFGTIFSVAESPVLSIALSGTNAVLTWPAHIAGYNLEWTTNLDTPQIWNSIGGQFLVTDPISTRQKFYRLKHP
jgi:uncharacterized repeat protein (TIGR03803 family)